MGRNEDAGRRIGFWCGRTNDAYAMGEADWAKESGFDVLTGIACRVYRDTGDWGAAADAVEAHAKAKGIDPKRHRWRPA